LSFEYPDCVYRLRGGPTQQRDQALALIDNAIEKVVPHINGQVIIETEVHRVIKGRPQTFKMTIEEWQARMKGCQVLVQLLDRKAKLLGIDAPVKVESPPVVVPESEEQRARARAALKAWTKFAVAGRAARAIKHSSKGGRVVGREGCKNQPSRWG
jgi:hypothetical protein